MIWVTARREAYGRQRPVEKGGKGMDINEFVESVKLDSPPVGLSDPEAALWWDAKGDWKQAHGLVDELESKDGMAVHAYLHRKEGALSNADYWYARAGRNFQRPELDDEWRALAQALLSAR
ncbi:MAG TPA: hypothetical protein VN753_03840 [Terracidiphilus sp.]|nr:hypothetical protein [Terracidiphilus sp.]